MHPLAFLVGAVGLAVALRLDGFTTTDSITIALIAASPVVVVAAICGICWGIHQIMTRRR